MPARAAHKIKTEEAVPPAWPAYTVEKWAIDRLTAYARNARKHSPQQIEQLRASLRQFGWTMPILAREDGTIIAGHGRVEAARAEGYKEIPVIVATGWSEDQCRAYTLADNRISLNSEWDDEMLGAELAELRDAGADLGLLGFGDKELVSFFADPNGGDADASPQLAGLAYSIVIRCTDETHQGELLAKLEKEGLTCEALIS